MPTGCFFRISDNLSLYGSGKGLFFYFPIGFISKLDIYFWSLGVCFRKTFVERTSVQNGPEDQTSKHNEDYLTDPMIHFYSTRTFKETIIASNKEQVMGSIKEILTVPDNIQRGSHRPVGNSKVPHSRTEGQVLSSWRTEPVPVSSRCSDPRCINFVISGSPEVFDLVAFGFTEKVCKTGKYRKKE